MRFPTTLPFSIHSILFLPYVPIKQPICPKQIVGSVKAGTLGVLFIMASRVAYASYA